MKLRFVFFSVPARFSLRFKQPKYRRLRRILYLYHNGVKKSIRIHVYKHRADGLIIRYFKYSRQYFNTVTSAYVSKYTVYVFIYANVFRFVKFFAGFGNFR